MKITDQIIAVNNARHDQMRELRTMQRKTAKDFASKEEIEETAQMITEMEFTIKGLDQVIKTLKSVQALAFIMKEAD